MATAGDVKFDLTRESLYDFCFQQSLDKGDMDMLFSQADLMGTNIVPGGDVMSLLVAVQSLVDKFLLVPVTERGTLCWRVRSRKDATDFLSLPTDEDRMVYALIEDAGSDGVWLRTMKQKTNLHEHTLNTSVKRLEQAGLVTGLKSVEYPTRRMYIKKSLSPSDRATGGAWFSDGELDVGFIEQVSMLAYKYVRERSSYYSSSGAAAPQDKTKSPKKGTVKGSAAAAASARKRPAAEMLSGGDANPRAAGASSSDAASSKPAKLSSRDQRHAHHQPALLPLPAGYTAYPTVRQIAQFIESSGVLQGITLSVADVQQLVDLLVWDGLVEKVRIQVPGQTSLSLQVQPIRGGGAAAAQQPEQREPADHFGYRASRIAAARVVPKAPRAGPDEEAAAAAGGGGGGDRLSEQLRPPERTNGLAEAPCGRCPVFEECEVGGPVSPASCEYFQQWLGLI